MAGKNSGTPEHDGDGTDGTDGIDGTDGTDGGGGTDNTGGVRAGHSSPRAGDPAPHARELRRRRLAAAAWVCAVAAAFLLGAWSFSHADPGGQYARHAPIDEAGVKRELTQAEQRARARTPNPSPTPSGSTAPGSKDSPGASDPGSPDSSESGDSPSRAPARTSTVRFPDGLGTAVAECRTDATTVKLLSWSPAEGYSADDVDPGPAARASVELEPVADDADDHTVLVRCVDGKPHTGYEHDSHDSDDDADDD
ncbi:hypothetical protein [Streptomyces iconiensis]|uniref:Septum formation initiator n=1 Tax=Streptomyces iconiensis TaxID=1384038 RepID=A0ABT7A063_9ACTN|nr:hypothetical protein [Streptomyces iconiensis]MDJ1134710.1 hypothetical protein [Streptomyces iconiensis]